MNMYEKRIHLRELLDCGRCVPALGAYDVISAKILEQAGFEILYTGSLLTSASQYGIPDCGLITLPEMVDISREIAKETDIPLICDADSGWYDSANIWRVIHEFESCGASAIHIEDTLFGKHTALKKMFLPEDVMCDKIRAAADAKKDKNFVIMARSDTYLYNNDLEDTIHRLNAYLDAGADAAYFCYFGSIDVLKDIRERIHGPLVLAGVNYVDTVEKESEIGANISIYWPQALNAAYRSVRTFANKFMETQDIAQASKELTFRMDDDPVDDMKTIIPYSKFEENVTKYNTAKQYTYKG